MRPYRRSPDDRAPRSPKQHGQSNSHRRLLAMLSACSGSGTTPTTASVPPATVSVPTATATTASVPTPTAETTPTPATPTAAAASATAATASPGPVQPGTVVAWGLNTYGQATVPAGLTGVIAIAASYQY